MTLRQEIPVLGEWFSLHFIENPGMAMGMEWGGEYGKLFLTLFRIVAVIVMAILIHQLSKNKASYGVIFGMSLIMAGAFGNIIDCVFYGQIFSKSTTREVAQMFPEMGGYAPYMYGKVVDMLHFRLIDTTWPEWVPFLGGQRLEFFRYIFNIADAAISVGIAYILLFQRNFFAEFSVKTQSVDKMMKQDPTNVGTVE